MKNLTNKISAEYSLRKRIPVTGYDEKISALERDVRKSKVDRLLYHSKFWIANIAAQLSWGVPGVTLIANGYETAGYAVMLGGLVTQLIYILSNKNIDRKEKKFLDTIEGHNKTLQMAKSPYVEDYLIATGVPLEDIGLITSDESIDPYHEYGSEEETKPLVSHLLEQGETRETIKKILSKRN